MISPVSMLFHYGSQTAATEVYSSGNEIVEIQGTSVSIGFGGNMYPVSWKVLQYVPAATSSTSQITPSTSGPIVQQEFSNYKTNRIENSGQNSVVLIMWNRGERIAEIYTFLPNGIDASLAMTNFNPTNATMIPTFSIQQKQDNFSLLSGFNYGGLLHGKGMSNTVCNIPSSFWGIRQGNISISWMDEQPIFNGGLIYSGIGHETTSLLFGPLSLSPNETYSIDPVILPEEYLGHGGAGGGGGGGTIADVNLSNLAVTTVDGTALSNGSVIGGDLMLKFSVNYDVTSGGSANLYFAGIASNGMSFQLGDTFSVSGSGTYTEKMPAQPSYYTGFTVEAGSNTLFNPGSDPTLNEVVYIRTTSPFVSGNSEVFPPDSVGSGNVYESSDGKLIAIMSQTAAGSGGWNDNLQSGYLNPLSFSASLYNKSRTLGVFSVSQEFKFTGNSMGTSPNSNVGSQFVTNKKSADSIQGTWGPSNITAIEQGLWYAAEIGLGLAVFAPELDPEYLMAIGVASEFMTIFGPFIFNTQNSYSQPKQYYDTVWDNLTGSTGNDNGSMDVPYYWENMLTGWGNYTDPVYGTDYEAGAGGLAYLFNFNESISLQSISGYNYVLNYFLYSVSMTLVGLNTTNETQLMWFSPSWYPPTYAASISIPLYMAEVG